MKTIAIIDTETGGLDPKLHPLLEVGIVLWSVEHRAIIEARSWLVASAENEAEAINRIPLGLLASPHATGRPTESIVDWAESADVLAAHNAPFDQGFLPELNGYDWIDTKVDLEWPGVTLGASLNETSLQLLGYAARGHRALADCMTLAKCFERTAEVLGVEAFETWLDRATRPKALFEVAERNFDEKRNALAKAAGFRWDATVKGWRRKMVAEDAKALPFAVREVRR